MDHTTRIIDCGRLTTTQWPGTVSVKDDADARINEALSRLNEFYVATNPRANTRCIDGRHDPELQEALLGPQVPGGAPGAALAWRLGVSEGTIGTATFLADAENMMDEYERRGFAVGGHRDAVHVGSKHMVGCGAIDGMDKAIGAMMTHLDDHKRIVGLLLGDAFDHHIYREMLGGAALVNFESERYFAGREKVMDILERRFPGSVSTLVGEHAEALVIVNTVPYTTFSSNRFADTFNGMQAFGYDIWRSLEIADTLLPRADQRHLRQNFVMARVMYTVAILMALTDGSQRLVLRLPQEVAEEV